MGDGLVLEQGTHSDLLRNAHGPYSRLVTAQKLREKREVGIKDSDSHTSASGNAKYTEDKCRDEIPFGLKTPGLSPSETVEHKKNLQDSGMKEDDHSLPYLFVRMGKLNRVGWRNYGIGVVAACGIYPFVSCSLQMF
jgi:ATP-binding cassette subfamily B (MDR/TAP) protein 1